MSNLIPQEPAKRRRLVRRVLIGTGIVAGVVVTVVIVKKLNRLEADVEVLVEVTGDVIDAADSLVDAVQIV